MLIDPPPTHTGTFGEIAFPLFVKSTPTLFPAPPGVFLRYLRLSRLELIGGRALAAPPAVTHLPRAPSFRRPPSSRRAGAGFGGGALGAGGGRVGFAGGGLF